VPRAAAKDAAGLKAAAAEPAKEEEDAAKSEEYSAEMSKKMGTNLTYHHEMGIDYNYLIDDVIVGSCLQTPADVDRLAEEGVTTVYCLQVGGGGHSSAASTAGRSSGQPAGRTAAAGCST
jgi:hypothetical protein